MLAIHFCFELGGPISNNQFVNLIGLKAVAASVLSQSLRSLCPNTLDLFVLQLSSLQAEPSVRVEALVFWIEHMIPGASRIVFVNPEHKQEVS